MENLKIPVFGILERDGRVKVEVLKDGEIVEEGEVLNIFDNPQHPYTQELLSAI